MLWLALVVYVARPVEFVCWDHLDVPKSPICEEGTKITQRTGCFFVALSVQSAYAARVCRGRALFVCGTLHRDPRTEVFRTVWYSTLIPVTAYVARITGDTCVHSGKENRAGLLTTESKVPVAHGNHSNPRT